MRWFERSETLDYIVASYAGVEAGKRQFIWEQPNGDIVLGNTRAFADHAEAHFKLPAAPSRWTEVHKVLRELGETIKEIKRHPRNHGRPFHNQEPEVRVLHPRSQRGAT